MATSTKWISDNYMERGITEPSSYQIGSSDMPENILTNPRLIRHLYKIRKHIEHIRKTNNASMLRK